MTTAHRSPSPRFRPACPGIRLRRAFSASSRSSGGITPISTAVRRCPTCSELPGRASRCTPASCRAWALSSSEIGASDSPQIGGGDRRDKLAEAGRQAEPSPAEPAPAPKVEDPLLQHPGPISLFVSRKLGKLFVRRGFAPVFDVPITIARPEEPLGTHVFTASRPMHEGVGIRWLAVSLGYDRAASRPEPAKRKGRATRDERPVLLTAD